MAERASNSWAGQAAIAAFTPFYVVHLIGGWPVALQLAHGVQPGSWSMKGCLLAALDFVAIAVAYGGARLLAKRPTQGAAMLVGAAVSTLLPGAWAGCALWLRGDRLAAWDALRLLVAPSVLVVLTATAWRFRERLGALIAAADEAAVARAARTRWLAGYAAVHPDAPRLAGTPADDAPAEWEESLTAVVALSFMLLTGGVWTYARHSVSLGLHPWPPMVATTLVTLMLADLATAVAVSAGVLLATRRYTLGFGVVLSVALIAATPGLWMLYQQRLGYGPVTMWDVNVLIVRPAMAVVLAGLALALSRPLAPRFNHPEQAPVTYPPPPDEE